MSNFCLADSSRVQLALGYILEKIFVGGGGREIPLKLVKSTNYFQDYSISSVTLSLYPDQARRKIWLNNVILMQFHSFTGEVLESRILSGVLQRAILDGSRGHDILKREQGI